MAFSIMTLFGGKTTQKHAAFDRRHSDRRQISDRRDSIRFDSDFEDRRSGQDRRRGHGIWNRHDQ
ncbi:MAG: hypothetical protein DWP95_04265 [Proteobacteria bacterium]|nr:MAG: hypothetical protein DWP95_04265 [Pseudomonadota bacterium]